MIALLPQAGVQTIALSAVCVYLMWEEKRWSWLGAALWIAAVGIALFWMVPAADFTTPSSINMQKLSFVESLGRTLYQSGIALMPVDWAGPAAGVGAAGRPAALLLTAIGPLLPALTIWMLRAATATGAARGLVLCLHVRAVDEGLPALGGRHFGLVLMLSIACLWIAVERKVRLGRVAIGVFGVQACAGIVAAAISATTPFTVGRTLTDWVRENGYETAAFVPDYPLYGLPASAYLGKPSVDVTGACLQSFVRWRFSPLDLPAGQTLLPAAVSRRCCRRRPGFARHAFRIRSGTAKTGGRHAEASLAIRGINSKSEGGSLRGYDRARRRKSEAVAGMSAVCPRSRYRLIQPAPFPRLRA